MIGVCLDTTITTRKCSRYTFRPFDYAPAQAVAFAPYLVKLGKKWHIAYADYAWGQSTGTPTSSRSRRTAARSSAPQDPARHRRHDAVPLQDPRQLRRLVRHLLRQGRGDHRQPGLRSRPHQEVQMGRRRRDRESTNLPALGNKIEGFVGINRYLPILDGPLNTPAHRKFFEEASARLKQIDPSGPLQTATFSRTSRP